MDEKVSEAARTLLRQRVQVEHACEMCGDRFTARPQAKYCSANCRNKAAYYRNLDQKRAAGRARYQRLAAEKHSAAASLTAPGAGDEA